MVMNGAPRKNSLRILVPVHEDLVPPDSVEGLSEEEIQPLKKRFF